MELSHHKLQSDTWQSAKPLVFVLDEIVEDSKSKKKGAKPGAPTSKNYGASMDIPKLKACEALILAWRCRFLWLIHC